MEAFLEELGIKPEPSEPSFEHCDTDEGPTFNDNQIQKSNRIVKTLGVKKMSLNVKNLSRSPNMHTFKFKKLA